MKKLIFAAIAIAAFACCTKNEVKEVVNDTQVTFQTVVGATSTKALNEGKTAYIGGTDPGFGTAAFYHTAYGAISGASNYIAKSKVEWDAAKNWWSTATAYYWPKENNGYLTFYSVSPWNNLAEKTNVTIDSTDGVKITDYDLNDATAQLVDVLVADVALNQTQNGSNGTYTGVPTVFRHKLAQINKFEFKTDEAYLRTAGVPGAIQFFVNKVTFKSVIDEGTYTSGLDVTLAQPGSWNLTGKTTGDIEWYVNGDKTADNELTETLKNLVGGTSSYASSSLATNKYLLVMPQAFGDNAGQDIELTYTIRHWWGTGAADYTDETYTTTKDLYDLHSSQTPLTGWNLNKLINYSVTIGVDQILWAPSVENWTEENTTLVEL